MDYTHSIPPSPHTSRLVPDNDTPVESSTGSSTESSKPDSPHITLASPQSTMLSRSDSSSPQNKSIYNRKATQLLIIPNISSLLKEQNIKTTSERIQAIINEDVDPTLKLLESQLKSPDLSKSQKKYIKTAIHNLNTIKALKQTLQNNAGDLSQHLAIASGYIGTSIPDLLNGVPENTLENKLALNHILCFLEHSITPVMNQTSLQSAAPKRIATQLHLLQKSHQKVIKKINKQQRKKIKIASPYAIKQDIMLTGDQKNQKKAQIITILKQGLNSSIADTLQLEPNMTQALKNIEKIDPNQFSAQFFTDKRNSANESQDEKNWKDAERLATLIVSRKTRSDIRAYGMHRRDASRMKKAWAAIADTLNLHKTLSKPAYATSNQELSYEKRLALSQVSDICSETFDSKIKAWENNPSIDASSIASFKEIQTKLKKVDLNKKEALSEVCNIWFNASGSFISKRSGFDISRFDPNMLEEVVMKWVNLLSKGYINNETVTPQTLSTGQAKQSTQTNKTPEEMSRAIEADADKVKSILSAKHINYTLRNHAFLNKTQHSDIIVPRNTLPNNKNTPLINPHAYHQSFPIQMYLQAQELNHTFKNMSQKKTPIKDIAQDVFGITLSDPMYNQHITKPSEELEKAATQFNDIKQWTEATAELIAIIHEHASSLFPSSSDTLEIETSKLRQKVQALETKILASKTTK